MTGFDKTGIHPLNRQRILDQLSKKQRLKPEPKVPSLMLKEDRFAASKATVTHLIDKYPHVLSSPTRCALNTLDGVVNEAILTKHAVEAEILKTKKKRAKTDDTMRRRYVRPPLNGPYKSVEICDIEKLASERTRKEWAQSQAREKAHHLREARKQVKELKEQWRQDPNGKGKKLWNTWFEEWKERNAEDFILLDEDNPLWHPPKWAIDLGRSRPNLEADWNNAYIGGFDVHLERPLQQVRITSTPDSDDIPIILDRPLHSTTHNPVSLEPELPEFPHESEDDGDHDEDYADSLPEVSSPLAMWPLAPSPTSTSRVPPRTSSEPVELNPPKYTGESQVNYIMRTVFNKGPTAPGGLFAPGGRFWQGGEDTSGGNHVHTPVDPMLEYEDVSDWDK